MPNQESVQVWGVIGDLRFPANVEDLLAREGNRSVDVQGVRVPFSEVLRRLPRRKYASVEQLRGDVRLVAPAILEVGIPSAGQSEVRSRQ